jgi:chromosomal replication initiator protein
MSLLIADCRRAAQVRYRITKQDMLGPSRKNRYAIPRMIAMTLAYELTDASLGAISTHFGGRDHSTVINARQRIAYLSDAIPPFGEDVEQLRLTLAVYKAQRALASHHALD